MKIATFTSSILLTASTLLSMASAHIAISNPPAQAGPWTKNPSDDVHAWIGFNGKKFPCGNVPLCLYAVLCLFSNNHH